MDIISLLNYAVKQNSSDLHLSTGDVPLMRKDGLLVAVEGTSVLDEATLLSMLKEVISEDQWNRVINKLEDDLSISIENLARFRINVFHQLRGSSAAFRVIPNYIPTFEELGLSDVFYDICNYAHGLVLVTGPTGCGKTTTLAAMINYINANKQGHVITIEDPIEYVFESKKSLVQQREIGRHTETFAGALRAVLREDPDYILVGEMRDLETIKLALTAAETGHLVFATLHTNSASETIDRVIDVFTSSEKEMVRSILASSLKAVISQRLLRKNNGGRVAVQEIMLSTPAIKNMIREDKVHQIYSSIQTSQVKGMRTLEQHWNELVQKGVLDKVEFDFKGGGVSKLGK